MKQKTLGYVALVILTLSYTICTAASSNLPVNKVPTELRSPNSRSELCAMLLRRINAEAPEPTEIHPVASFFSMIGLMLSNSSGMAVSELDLYKGLESVDYARELISILKDKNTEQRRGHISEIYQLFGRASSSGDDFNLAALMYSIGALTKAIENELFFAGFSSTDGRANSEVFHIGFMNSKEYPDPDKELNAIRDAWDRLAPHHRAGFAEWFGRAFSDGAKSYSFRTIKFTDNRPSSVSICQMVPDLRLTLEDYLAANNGNKREMTRRYYRNIASKVLSVYGIVYSEDEGTSATPATIAFKTSGFVSRVKRLLLSCK